MLFIWELIVLNSILGETYELRNNLVVRPFKTHHVIPSQVCCMMSSSGLLRIATMYTVLAVDFDENIVAGLCCILSQEKIEEAVYSS